MSSLALAHIRHATIETLFVKSIMTMWAIPKDNLQSGSTKRQDRININTGMIDHCLKENKNTYQGDLSLSPWLLVYARSWQWRYSTCKNMLKTTAQAVRKVPLGKNGRNFRLAGMGTWIKGTLCSFLSFWHVIAKKNSMTTQRNAHKMTTPSHIQIQAKATIQVCGFSDTSHWSDFLSYILQPNDHDLLRIWGTSGGYMAILVTIPPSEVFFIHRP